MSLNITTHSIRYKSKKLKCKLSHTRHIEVKWKLKMELRLDEWFSNSLILCFMLVRDFSLKCICHMSITHYCRTSIVNIGKIRGTFSFYLDVLDNIH